ncbi:Protein kinase domain-containing protein 27 [Elsinoe fawcettii]|nr:Protein kinase domain-containing protein 27 [Elsinoe fawcettii]
MANNERHRQMSLIPYQSNQEVVLRHGTAVVTLDPQSQQLTLRDTSASSIEYGQCPYCHRPFHEEQNAFPPRRDPSPTRQDHGFVNPDYFRLLAERSPVSANSTGPPSPGRPLRALRSGDSRNVSASGPPSNAEFVGTSPAPAGSDHGIKGSSFLPGYFQRFFVERRMLGRGGRGVVLLVEHVLDDVSLGEFACKRIPVGNDHDWLAKVLVEVQLLQRLNHPNLVSYRHVWLEDAQTTKFGPSVPCVFILQQYCNAGDLHDYVQAVISSGLGVQRKGSLAGLLSRGPGQMPLDQIFSFFRDIASGLNHLHSNGYIHRDLKPSNCLLHRDGNTTTVHVSDFGEVQAATAQRASTGATGTLSYCAPEVLQQDRPGGAYGNFTTKSDVFSLGMILYYMCFGDLPYTNADVHEENEDMDLLRAEISAWTGFTDKGKGKKRSDLPEQLYRFLKRLLSLNPAERPSTSEILQSIQSGTDLDELPSPTLGRPELHSRVSSLDTPQPSSALQRKRLSFSDPPILQPPRGRRQARSVSESSTTPTPKEGLGIREGRSRSTSFDASDLSRPTSRGQSRTTIVRRATGRSASRNGDGWGERPGVQRRKSELLLLPPPPDVGSWGGVGWVLRTVGGEPSLNKGVRLGLFLVKVGSVMVPCYPYAIRGAVGLPLLGVASLDLGLDVSWLTSVMLLAVHAGVLAWALKGGAGGMCAGWATWEGRQQ